MLTACCFQTVDQMLCARVKPILYLTVVRLLSPVRAASCQSSTQSYWCTYIDRQEETPYVESILQNLAVPCRRAAHFAHFEVEDEDADEADAHVGGTEV